MNEDKLGLSWSAVEKALAEGTFSGYKIGILETEKLFNEMLKGKKIPGRTTDRKIRYIKNFLSQKEKLEYSRNIYERILNEMHFDISRDETKNVISGYWQAVLDIEEAVQSLSLWDKLTLRFKYLRGVASKNTVKIGAVVLVAAVLIWFLGETKIGLRLAQIIVMVVHFFLFKILFWAAIALGALLVIGIIIYLILRGKRQF